MNSAPRRSGRRLVPGGVKVVTLGPHPLHLYWACHSVSGYLDCQVSIWGVTPNRQLPDSGLGSYTEQLNTGGRSSRCNAIVIRVTYHRKKFKIISQNRVDAHELVDENIGRRPSA